MEEQTKSTDAEETGTIASVFLTYANSNHPKRIINLDMKLWLFAADLFLVAL